MSVCPCVCPSVGHTLFLVLKIGYPSGACVHACMYMCVHVCVCMHDEDASIVCLPNCSFYDLGLFLFPSPLHGA